MAKGRRGKGDPKKGQKAQPAPIPQFNRTPTPEPLRDPNIVFAPGFHNPVNHGHITICEDETAVKSVRDGGDEPTRPGSKKRLTNASHEYTSDDRPRLLKRLKSAHDPRGYHAGSRTQHAASIALYRTMSHADDFTERNQTVANILFKSTTEELACIATSPANGAARIETPAKTIDPNGKGKHKEQPLGMGGEWNDWVMLLYLRRCVEERLAANPAVPSAADRENIWGSAQPGDEVIDPAPSGQVNEATNKNIDKELNADEIKETTTAAEEQGPRRKRCRSIWEDPDDMYWKEPAEKRNRTGDVSTTLLESTIATPQDEEPMFPLKLADGEWDIPLLPEPEPEPKSPQNRDVVGNNQPKSPKLPTAKAKTSKARAVKSKAPKTQTPKTQSPNTEASQTDNSKLKAPKPQVPKSQILKPLAPKLAPNSRVPDSKAPDSKDPSLKTPKSQILKPQAPSSQVPTSKPADAKPTDSKDPKSISLQDQLLKLLGSKKTQDQTTEGPKIQDSKTEGPNPEAAEPQTPQKAADLKSMEADIPDSKAQAPESQAPASQAPPVRKSTRKRIPKRKM